MGNKYAIRPNSYKFELLGKLASNIYQSQKDISLIPPFAYPVC